MPKPFDLLTLFAAFGRERRVAINDPSAIGLFVREARTELGSALANPTLLYGKRTENMFEALVVGLGHFKLLKVEDASRVHPARDFQAPDFRVVLEDGRTWLVEVKNVHEEDPENQKRKLMSPAYLSRLKRYAAEMKCPLKLAVFWSRWGIWTLFSPDAFAGPNGGLTVDMGSAVMKDEMSVLGDCLIGTKPPLRLIFLGDPQKPGQLDADGKAIFTIGAVRMYCGAAEITLPLEREIAWILMQYGEWREENRAVIENGILKGMEFEWNPLERSNNGFEMIGSLSRIFARYYATRTLDAEEVVQLETEFVPGWLKPLNSESYQGQALPLWRFVVQPDNSSGAETM